MQKNAGWKVLVLAGIVLVGALLEQLGGTKFLWAFPVHYPGFALWLGFTCADLLLLELRWLVPALSRLVLWTAGLSFFAALSGFPVTGLVLVLLPVLLWVTSRRGGLLRFALPVLALLFVLGHDGRYFHWNLQGTPLGWRFSFHLVALFLFFRSCSWLVAVAGRGERPGFLATMEYFLAPAFWLSPAHANHLVWEHAAKGAQPDYAKGASPDDDLSALGWIGRGLLHSLLLSVLGAGVISWLAGFYAGGARAAAWYEWLCLGPALFALAYFDKSQVSYLTAGFLRLAGWNIEPDFRAPWLARDLLDFWRRFHYWLWEFYMNVIYMPLSVWIGRRYSPRRALPLALFLAFTLGTTAGHYLSYRAPILACTAAGLAFGLATMAHYYARPVLRRAEVGIPLTWVTVFLLYMMAYPVFGLGWSVGDFLGFWR